MKAKFKVVEPKDVLFEMTIFATAGEWEDIKKHLEGLNPHSTAGTLRIAIQDLLSQANDVFGWVEDRKIP